MKLEEEKEKWMLEAQLFKIKYEKQQKVRSMIRIEGSLCYCGARAAFGVFYFSQLFVFFTDRYYYQKFAQKLKMFL